jgi:O-Antigen ligase/Tetratricopeptide repeat
VASVFFGDGSSDGPIFPIGTVALLTVAACVAAVSLGVLPAPRIGRPAWAAIVLVAGFVLWAGISIVWSIEPDRSWASFNRGVTYLAVLSLGVFVGALVRRAPRVTAALLALVLGLAVAWALAGKVVPGLGPDADRSARLRSPVGYWNALALLIAMSLPLWLWLAARRDHARTLRAGATVMLAASFIALALTTSRGGILVGAIAVGAWLLLGSPRLESAVALLISAPVAAALAAWALGRPALAEAAPDAGDAARDGALFGLLLAVGLAVVAALALRAARVEPERRPFLVRLVAALAIVAGIAALVIGAVRVGNPVEWVGERIDEFRNPPNVQLPQGPERLVAFSSNQRWTWWKEAARIFADDPVTGTGAGTFALARKQIRKDTQLPLAPHNVGLQALSETGIIGFLLLVGAAAAAIWAVAGTLRRLGGADRAAAAALAAALAAYLAHSLLDMGWEYVAVSAPFFLGLGVLFSAASEPVPPPGRSRLVALAAAALALTAAASLAFPWLAERRIEDAYAALERGDFGEAADQADAAAGLNPLSIEPLQIGAVAAEQRGDLDAAERLLRDAVELQPENGETWYELGRFEFEVRDDLGAALRDLDRSYALDSFGPSGPVLDEVRAEIVRRSP